MSQHVKMMTLEKNGHQPYGEKSVTFYLKQGTKTLSDLTFVYKIFYRTTEPLWTGATMKYSEWYLDKIEEPIHGTEQIQDMRRQGHWASDSVTPKNNLTNFACLQMLPSGILAPSLDYDCKIKKKLACNHKGTDHVTTWI